MAIVQLKFILATEDCHRECIRAELALLRYFCLELQSHYHTSPPISSPLPRLPHLLSECNQTIEDFISKSNGSELLLVAVFVNN
jgi:hypothetical protein